MRFQDTTEEDTTEDSSTADDADMEEEDDQEEVKLGMISHKKSLITIFGHKNNSQISSKNFIIFIKKIEIFH